PAALSSVVAASLVVPWVTRRFAALPAVPVMAVVRWFSTATVIGVAFFLAGDDLTVGGERRTVTVLFADLRDSTALAETMTGPEVVAFLNDYVGAMAA